MKEWKQSKVMSSDRARKISEQLSIPEKTIYKWFWDRNRGYLAKKSINALRRTGKKIKKN